MGKYKYETKDGIEAVDEAIEFLRNQEAVGTLEWSPEVTKAAEE